MSVHPVELYTNVTCEVMRDMRLVRDPRIHGEELFGNSCHALRMLD